ncbi:uncharacterized protein C8Q71DRAFT_862795 [Rhodofomes roseus]|uniref:Uncharacterized protein n=1 Tax=Rhodofomes roseus TaxID=34475 RepID=A0ABQ8JZY1_9APHY|nr:uncharacterized protein C8Q71DRAFT_862795 [Rhodofomes roseus]KAH9829931.1 hypothetical protein C8Q71DRAFT_862795 [Rhodofomes roseus]
MVYTGYESALDDGHAESWSKLAVGMGFMLGRPSPASQRALSYLARTIFANTGEESSVLVSTMTQQYGEEDKFAWSYDTCKGVAGGPKITKDGVTVAKSIQLKDKFKNLGVHLVQDFASKTNKIVGDGTTTTTIPVRAIYAEGVKNIAAGCNPMGLRRGSQAAVERVVEFLSSHAKTITTTTEIAQAMEKVGKEGVITVKKARTINDEIELTEGMRFNHGFISLYFVTDVKSQKAKFEKPLVLSESKISRLQDILLRTWCLRGSRLEDMQHYSSPCTPPVHQNFSDFGYGL